MHTQTIRLRRLSLRNFKGVREFDLLTSGQTTSVYGDNGAGKTTLADAWSWVLFGKDSRNQSDFDIKTIVDGKPVSGIEHSVEAEIETSQGTLILKRVYKENWTKKRGSATSEMTGNTTDYFVNSVPVQKKDYDSRIAAICPEKTFRLLTDPLYFNVHLPWAERRKALLDLCGDVSDLQVIDSDPRLASLPEVVGSHKIDDFLKILGARRKEVNQELTTLPVRIDELRRLVPAAPQKAPAEDLAALRIEFVGLQEQKGAIAAGAGVAEATSRLRGVEAELLGIQNRITQSSNEARSLALGRTRELAAKLAEAEDSATRLVRSIAQQEADKARLEVRLQALRERHKEIANKPFSGESTCPSCGQALPEERVKAATEEHNRLQAESLEAIRAEGHALKKNAEDLSALIEGSQPTLEEARNLVESYREQIAAVEVPAAAAPDFTEDVEWSAMAAQKHDIQVEIESLRSGSSSSVEAVDEAIRALQARIDQAERDAAADRQAKESEKRIAELSAREKELAGIFEEIERGMHLIETFVRSKVSLLTTRINGHFRLAKFRLFEEQINGGLTECCEAMIAGVPFSSLNHASTVNVGLDIIDALQAGHGISVPVFVDGAESVTELLPMTCQIVKLAVSAGDRELRVADPIELALSNVSKTRPQEALL